ncbi:hypothetical protein L2E82_32326 [Cichorium intybus]|uniref:Uncharacterized protein n=1 Tax=Cichorium intybus TaxID=13427 RepID=A0ACB9BGX2_CICIN|nr:hypothetical protein L2E82_32326 [Cichorium intybus]
MNQIRRHNPASNLDFFRFPSNQNPKRMDAIRKQVPPPTSISSNLPSPPSASTSSVRPFSLCCSIGGSFVTTWLLLFYTNSKFVFLSLKIPGSKMSLRVLKPNAEVLNKILT